MGEGLRVRGRSPVTPFGADGEGLRVRGRSSVTPFGANGEGLRKKNMPNVFKNIALSHYGIEHS